MKTLSYEEALKIQKTAQFAIAANEVKNAMQRAYNSWRRFREQFPLDSELLWTMDKDNNIKVFISYENRNSLLM